MEMKIATLNREAVESMTGYKPFTSFFEDFSVADNFGTDAIIDTYDRAMNEWKDSYKYLTELVMVLNWKIWQHADSNSEYAKLYDGLWKLADEYALEHLEGDELNYFFDVTD
ncbi:hypothetical protein [Sharpea azabuensis]|uniref:hypothetical protein n=1 Tax=Sharpea azabuensis TaxID=322505 RepID=UPI001931DBAB|nr:hypothetical protein [Sharpea azabuensis]